MKRTTNTTRMSKWFVTGAGLWAALVKRGFLSAAALAGSARVASNVRLMSLIKYPLSNAHSVYTICCPTLSFPTMVLSRAIQARRAVSFRDDVQALKLPSSKTQS